MNEEEKNFMAVHYAVLDSAIKDCMSGAGDGTKRGILIVSNTESQTLSIYTMGCTEDHVRNILVGSLELMLPNISHNGTQAIN